MARGGPSTTEPSPAVSATVLRPPVISPGPLADDYDEITFHRGDGGLGDLVCTLSAVQGWKRRFPNCNITYAGHEELIPLLEGHPDISKLIPAAQWSGAAINLGHRPHALGECPGNYHEAQFADKVQFSRIELFAEAAGVKPEIPKLHLFPDELKAASAAVGSDPFVAVVLRTSSKWRDFRYTEELIRKLPFRVVTIDSELSLEGIQSTVGMSLRQLAAVCAKASVVVSPDTGWLHVAGALGKPRYGLFGSIDPAKRMDQYQVADGVHVGMCPKGKQFCWYSVCQGPHEFQPCMSSEPTLVAAKITRFCESVMGCVRVSSQRVAVKAHRPKVYVNAGGGLGDFIYTYFGKESRSGSWTKLDALKAEFPDSLVTAVLTVHASNAAELIALDPRIDSVVTWPWLPPGDRQEHGWRQVINPDALRLPDFELRHGLTFESSPASLYLSDADRLSLSLVGSEFLALHPFSGLKARCGWSGFYEVARLAYEETGLPVVVLGNTETNRKDERAFSENWERPITGVVDLTNKLSLRAASWVAQNCKAFIGTHSAMLAAAWMTERPSVFVYPNDWGSGIRKHLRQDGGETGTWALNHSWTDWIEAETLDDIRPERVITKLTQLLG